MSNTNCLIALAFICLLVSCRSEPGRQKERTAEESRDPLPSWKEGPVKKAIIDFVNKTTTQGGKDFVPVADRIACFDNDGTLWSEQPMYFQLAFTIDRIKALAPQHPEWKSRQPFKAVLEGNMHQVQNAGEQALLPLIAAAHANISTEEFSKAVKGWIDTAVHTKTGRRYREMTFLPMIELLRYLRQNAYKTFIVSGGGVDFMRVWAPEAYTIPEEQIIGSSLKLKYEVQEGGTPRLIKLPELNFIDDNVGKPAGIYQHIGKRPILSFGNSDGDYEMLQWTTTAAGYPRLGILLHHTDGEREFAYDSASSVGRLSRGLADAGKNGWLIVDMKNDWKTIYSGNSK